MLYCLLYISSETFTKVPDLNSFPYSVIWTFLIIKKKTKEHFPVPWALMQTLGKVKYCYLSVEHNKASQSLHDIHTTHNLDI